LYWNFIDKHIVELAANPRTALMAKNLDRISPAEKQAIREKAQILLTNLNDC
jgi:deoxyribodipyrimidine photolyase-related protein